MSDHRPYEGEELELFAQARNWKRYWSGKIRRHLGKSVLEVGAGLGTNTLYLLGEGQESWLGLEPDGELTAQIPAMLAEHPLRDRVRTRTGILRNLPADEVFDTILYIDVLEHIEDDRGEMQLALAHLAPKGKIIVLSPAHPSLFSEFDRALGHYRRYTRASMRACTPPGAKLVELYALDGFGLVATLANRLLLRQSMPRPGQIAFWDGWLVPVSRCVDPLIAFSIGKSLIAVWEKS